MSQLERSHYEALVAVVEAGSVTKAADRLLVTQSAVSHRLAEAERRLGFPLFDRRPARPIRPTPAALALYQAAKRALAELQRAESDFLRAEGLARDVVRLGVGSYDCYHWLPGFVSHAADRLPDMLFELVVVGDSPAEQLAEGRVDVVLAIGEPRGSFESRPLFDDELVLISPPDHEAAHLPFVDAEIFETEVYLTYSRVASPGFEFDRFLRPAGVTARTMLVIEQTNAIAEMVASGGGVSILSRWAMSPWLETGKIAATQLGPQGLLLQWSSLLRPGAEATSPEGQVSELLAGWLRATADPFEPTNS